MQSMCLAHECSPAAKATANLGLDFCSYVREIPPTCLVLFWHYLFVRHLVGGGGAWREGGGGKLLKALNSFLNTAIVISIA